MKRQNDKEEVKQRMKPPSIVCDRIQFSREWHGIITKWQQKKNIFESKRKIYTSIECSLLVRTHRHEVSILNFIIIVSCLCLFAYCSAMAQFTRYIGTEKGNCGFRRRDDEEEERKKTNAKPIIFFFLMRLLLFDIFFVILRCDVMRMHQLPPTQ